MWSSGGSCGKASPNERKHALSATPYATRAEAVDGCTRQLDDPSIELGLGTTPTAPMQ